MMAVSHGAQWKLCTPRPSWASLVGSALCICDTSLLGAVDAIHNSVEALHVGLSSTRRYAPFPLADFNLHSSAVINHNCEYYGFQ